MSEQELSMSEQGKAELSPWMKRKSKYKNVLLHLDPPVWQQVRKQAYQDNTSIASVVRDAIYTYFKWLKAAEIKEKKEGKIEETKQELKEATEALETIRQEKRHKAIQKRLKSMPKRSKRFPGERIYKIKSMSEQE